MEHCARRRPRLRRWAGTALALLLVLCLTGTLTASAAAASISREVLPIGRAVGIKLFSDGVLVVGLSPVETSSGDRYPGRDCGLKTGDVITHMDGSEVNTIEEVQALLAEKADQPMTLQAMRGERQVQLRTAAVENRSGVYQLGVWLRDSMAGIGTVTFYDPHSGVFAALGHGISDADTARLMPLESGGILRASVSDVKRGQSGDPGELHGQFQLNRDLGALYANTARGVFGTAAASPWGKTGQTVPVAQPRQVHTGPAVIRSNVRGDRVEEFQVRITHLDTGENTDRNLMLQVEDPRLLELTGGIVQGMSGSPILQDGRLVGAVTHVLVNDPTRGYGIFAERMIRQAEESRR